MRFSVQRRSIRLDPATDSDIQWIATQYNDEKMWTMFGFDGPARQSAMASYFQNKCIIGVIKKTQDDSRIGFVNLMKSESSIDSWQFIYAISKASERNAFNAIFALDAIAHYAFDHLNIERIEWSVRSDNAASLAVIRRIGYEPYTLRKVEGVKYLNFEVNLTRWKSRKKSLYRPIGSPFRLSEWRNRPNIMAKLAYPYADQASTIPYDVR